MASLQNNPETAVIPLVDAATIQTDAALSNCFSVTLAGARTLANPTNMRPGQTIRWFVKQDATGTRTLAYGTAFKFPAGTTPTLSSIATRSDILEGYTPDGVNLFMRAAIQHVGF